MNSSYLYTGSPINPIFVLKFDNQVLENGIDYSINITNNINVGTANVEIVGKGRFTGVANRTFEILPVTVKALNFYIKNTILDYNGQAQIPKLSIKFGNMVLVEGKDYNVDYCNNINIGKALAKITLKGNYSGTMDIPFYIK